MQGNIILSNYEKILLIIPVMLLAVLTLFEMCVESVRLTHMVTPTSFRTVLHLFPVLFLFLLQFVLILKPQFNCFLYPFEER